MSKKLFSSLAALVTAIAGMGVVKADTGYTATFTSSITFSNVGSGTASVLINFYNQNSGTAIPIPTITLEKGASKSVFLGSTTLLAGFNGSAVISSDQAIAATAVQIATNSGTLVKNRPLSNGFASGASQVLIATTLKNKFNNTERFNVQNASTGNVDLTVNFYDADNGGTLKTSQSVTALPPGAAKTFDLGTIAALPDGFNGSAVVNAVQSGTTTPASIVASALELSTTGNSASAFEGVTGGSNTLYMPSALCNAFGGFNSFYAIGNADTTDAAVTVTYSNGATDTATITPGAKKSFNTCLATNMTQGFSGAATITSTGGKIVGIGKVQGLGVTTAFLGETAGSANLACPYVRWTPTAIYNSGQRQRGFLAIQNVGGALAAGAVTVNYIDANGVVKGTQTLNALATGAKQSVNSSQTALGDADFGFDGTNFGGGVTIVGPAGSQLVAITRIQSSDPGGASGYGEDYNCIPF